MGGRARSVAVRPSEANPSPVPLAWQEWGGGSFPGWARTMEQGEARGSPEGAHGSVGKGDWMWLQQQVTPLWLFLSRGPFVLLTVPVLPSATRCPLTSPELLSPPEAPLW